MRKSIAQFFIGLRNYDPMIRPNSTRILNQYQGYLSEIDKKENLYTAMLDDLVFNPVYKNTLLDKYKNWLGSVRIQKG